MALYTRMLTAHVRAVLRLAPYRACSSPSAAATTRIAQVAQAVAHDRAVTGGHVPVLCTTITEQVVSSEVTPQPWKAGSIELSAQFRAAAQHGRVVLDATVGHGGHAEAILRADPSAVLVGLDLDARCLAAAAERLRAAGVADRAALVHSSAAEAPAVLQALGAPGVHSVLLDLGVNSAQFSAERGLSFRANGPLDMRLAAWPQDAQLELPSCSEMQRPKHTAQSVLASLDYADLKSLFQTHDVGAWSSVIARALVQWRGAGSSRRAIKSTLELRHVVDTAISEAVAAGIDAEQGPRTKAEHQTATHAIRKSKELSGKPSVWKTQRTREVALKRIQARKPVHVSVLQRVFQALRMVVNAEEAHIAGALAGTSNCVLPGGTMSIIAFAPHEDVFIRRLVARLAGPAVLSGPMPKVRHPLKAWMAALRETHWDGTMPGAPPNTAVDPAADGLLDQALATASASPPWKLLTPQPIRPEPAEARQNARARSARLWQLQAPASPASESDVTPLQLGYHPANEALYLRKVRVKWPDM